MRRSIVLLAATGILALSLVVVTAGFSPATQAMSLVDSVVSMNHHGSQHLNHAGDCPMGSDGMHRQHHDSSVQMHGGMMGEWGAGMHQMMDGDRGCPMIGTDSDE